MLYSECTIDPLAIQQRREADGSHRDERGRRLFAASEARATGRGGIAAVSRITGVARSTIGRGLKDLDDLPPGKVRRPGGGARTLTDKDPTLLDDLKRLIEPVTLGDPERPLIWVSKSPATLAAALQDAGHKICRNSVGTLLAKLGFSRQTNRKADEGSRHPDRNVQFEAQFEHINTRVCEAQSDGEPLMEDLPRGNAQVLQPRREPGLSSVMLLHSFQPVRHQTHFDLRVGPAQTHVPVKPHRDGVGVRQPRRTHDPAVQPVPKLIGLLA